MNEKLGYIVLRDGTYKVKECPFCKSFDLIVHRPLDNTEYYVACKHCSAMGPDASSPREAIEFWNTRYK